MRRTKEVFTRRSPYYNQGGFTGLSYGRYPFDFVPEIVFIVCNMHVSMAAHTLFIRGQEKMGCAYDGSRGSGFGPAELNIEWTASGVKWYDSGTAYKYSSQWQMNLSGARYYYAAIV